MTVQYRQKLVKILIQAGNWALSVNILRLVFRFLEVLFMTGSCFVHHIYPFFQVQHNTDGTTAAGAYGVPGSGLNESQAIIYLHPDITINTHTIIFPHPLLPLTQLFARFVLQGYKVPMYVHKNSTLHNIPWGTGIHIIYLFISWWVFGLVLFFGCYKKCCWIFMYKPLWGHVFSLLFNIYSGAELLGHMEILFNFLRNCQAIFQRGYTILYFHQPCVMVLISLPPQQCLSFSSGSRYPSGCEVDSHCGFDLYFSNDCMLGLFSCAACAKLLQSCPTLWDPMNCRPPDSSVHGILQVRILEWVAMPSSRGSSQPRDQTHIS